MALPPLPHYTKRDHQCHALFHRIDEAFRNGDPLALAAIESEAKRHRLFTPELRRYLDSMTVLMARDPKFVIYESEASRP